MEDSEGGRPAGRREQGGRGGERPQNRAPRSGGGTSPAKLRAIAEELEEFGKALLAHARDLQRMSEPREDRGDRPPRRTGGTAERSSTSSPRRTSPRDGEKRSYGARDGEKRSFGGRDGEKRPRTGGSGEQRSRGSAGGDQRPRKNRSEAPDWAPTPKRKR